MTTNVQTVRLDDSVKKAASVICLRKFSGLPVLDDNDNLVGMITEVDILRSIYPSYAELFNDPNEFKVFDDLSRRYGATAHQKVGEVFTKKVYSVEPDTPLLNALSMMVSKHIRRLPVVDTSGRLIGLVSQGDIHQALFHKEFLVEESKA